MKLFHSQTATALTLVIGCLSLGAPSVQATPITVTGAGLGQTVAVVTNNGTVTQNDWTGQILVNMLGGSYVTYCFDLFTGISASNYNSTFDSPANYANGGRAAWIYEQNALTATTNFLSGPATGVVGCDPRWRQRLQRGQCAPGQFSIGLTTDCRRSVDQRLRGTHVDQRDDSAQRIAGGQPGAGADRLRTALPATGA